ncbi:MAG: hypothetical protein WC262_09565, partial [Bacteroidales bacterium]
GVFVVSDSKVTISGTSYADTDLTFGTNVIIEGYGKIDENVYEYFGVSANAGSHYARFFGNFDVANRHIAKTTNAGGSEYSTLADVDDTAYYRWTIKRTSSSFMYYRDGVLAATHTTRFFSDAANIRIGGNSGAALEMDWVRCRKYAATEPTHGAWGTVITEPPSDTTWTYENTPTDLALVADTWTTFKIEGISVDTSGMTNLAVFIWVDDTDAAVDDVVYISQVQLCEGDIALPFQPKRYSEELRDCQRFYQALSIQTENGTRWIAFPATMRASPTLTTDTGSTANQSPDGFDLTHTASAQADISADAEL